MANDLNQCNFIGRLGSDPEVRYMPDGSAVCNFTIAVGWKSKDSEGAEWVRISSFGKLAEICGEYLKKGSRVFVNGKFKTRKWQDQSGQDRYTTEIRCSEMQMLDGKPNDGNQQQAIKQPSSNGQANQQRPAQAQAQQRQQAPSQQDFDEFDDDIPF